MTDEERVSLIHELANTLAWLIQRDIEIIAADPLNGFTDDVAIRFADALPPSLAIAAETPR